MSTIEAVGLPRFDPLLRDLALPLTNTFHPAGFPLDLATNSRDVMEAAAESWDQWSPEFATGPVQMRVLVEPEGELAGQPRFRMQGHLIHAVSDPHNFAVADTQALFASICVSAKTAADHTWLRWFYTESMGYMLLTQRYLTGVHAACIARNGTGFMLCGESNAGKSTLAFACARAGFTYLADDCTWLLTGSRDRVALGRPHQIRFREDVARHFPELESWTARARPNGKIGIEVPTRALPGIVTAKRCHIGRIVFLHRDSAVSPHVEAVPRAEVLQRLLSGMHSYGEAVNRMHDTTVETLTEVPAFHLHYRSLEDGIRLLSEIS
jgi:hypothetical protein